MNCVESVWHNSARSPHRMAIWGSDDRSVDFQTFAQLSFSMQEKLLAQNIECGAVVVFFARPSPEFYAAVAGVIGLGCTALFVERWLANPAQIISRMNPSFVVVDDLSRWFARGILPKNFKGKWLNISKIPLRNGKPISAQVDPESAATITFTSGSTGEPKGILRTHRVINNLVRIHKGADDQQSAEGPDLCVMNGLALLHLATGRGSVLVGSDWSKGKIQKISQICEALEPTTLSTGPKFLECALSAPGLGGLRKIYVGGAPTDISLMERVFDKWKTAEIIHVYGSTEVEPISLIDARRAVELSKSAGYFQMLHVGKPIPGVEVNTINGELLVRSSETAAYRCEAEHLNFDSRESIDQTKWIATGDRMIASINGMVYQGRMTCDKGRFVEEQLLYRGISTSRAFITKNTNGRRLIVAERGVDDGRLRRIQDDLLCDSALKLPIIVDRRHRSRLDRSATLRPKTLAQRWMRFFQERSPLAIIAIIAAGPTLSPEWRWAANGSHYVLAALSFGMIALSLVLARLNDEIKDFDKDQIDNPSRPLPRGLLTISEAQKGQFVVGSALLMIAATLGAICPVSLWATIPTMLWLHLIAKNFYAPRLLDKSLLVSTGLHQLMVVPLYGLPILIGESLRIIPNQSRAISYVAAMLFGSLLYEIARKMGKDSPRITTNYRQAWGRWGCSIMIAATGIAFSICLAGIGLELVALTVATLLIALIARYIFVPQTAKVIEGLSAVANLVALWAPTLMRVLISAAKGG